MNRVYKKIMKASPNEMQSISFWAEIVNICEDVLINSTNAEEKKDAESYLTDASYICNKISQRGE